jgi:hypothetical protein
MQLGAWHAVKKPGVDGGATESRYGLQTGQGRALQVASYCMPLIPLLKNVSFLVSSSIVLT